VGARLGMTSKPQEIVSGKSLAAKSSEVDFAIVLSRVIASIENDPAQLRSAVYELARIKLQTELSINVSEKRDLALALESAIEHVETVSSKHERRIEGRWMRQTCRGTLGTTLPAPALLVCEGSPGSPLQGHPRNTSRMEVRSALGPAITRAGGILHTRGLLPRPQAGPYGLPPRCPGGWAVAASGEQGAGRRGGR
jgi:hypothetical protein